MSEIRNSKPIKITNAVAAHRVKNALFLILWVLSTQDLEYLHNLKNGVGNLDFVGVVIDEIIEARNMKRDAIYDEILDEPNL